MNCKNKSFMTKKKAFTLIELLIVIAIIGILFIVLVSKVDFATDKAKATGVQTDFRSFQMAFDMVAKEHAGFNTFGWDTGDDASKAPAGYTYTNQNQDKADGKRNSYDEGDANLNGTCDAGETFTGRKIYTEEWTGTYTLIKPGTTGYDRTALSALETAINANLDPKLQITINSDGSIEMANGAQDPWNREYHGQYYSAEDGKDRGAIFMFSDGPNNAYGSAWAVSNGVASVTVPNNNKNGKDDYSLVSVYSYLNGYGETLTATTGFSNNQMLTNGNSNGITIIPGGDDNGETPNEPITFVNPLTEEDIEHLTDHSLNTHSVENMGTIICNYVDNDNGTHTITFFCTTCNTAQYDVVCTYAPIYVIEETDCQGNHYVEERCGCGFAHANNKTKVACSFTNEIDGRKYCTGCGFRKDFVDGGCLNGSWDDNLQQIITCGGQIHDEGASASYGGIHYHTYGNCDICGMTSWGNSFNCTYDLVGQCVYCGERKTSN